MIILNQGIGINSEFRESVGAIDRNLGLCHVIFTDKKEYMQSARCDSPMSTQLRM